MRAYASKLWNHRRVNSPYNPEANEVESKTARLVKRLFEAYKDELIPRLPTIRNYNLTSRAKHGLAGGSTGNPDCGFLYLLVRAFHRKSIFEIGTYVGTSAITMGAAARANGGKLVTCDPENYACLPEAENDVIRYLQMDHEQALSTLKKERVQIDFVFADWQPSLASINLINELASQDLIFTAHDYVLPHDKGVVAFELMSQHYRRANECTWFLPDEQPIQVSSDIQLQQCTAAMIPNILLDPWL